MSNKLLTYEHPLNERVRAFLRLEHLLQQVDHRLHINHSWDSRVAIECIIEVFNLLERSDLHKDAIKELERYITSLTRLSLQPSVDKPALQKILGHLEKCLEKLQSGPGKSALSLRDNEFLNTIRQRLSIPGGTCCFDIPAYHYWLNLPFQTRQQDMILWTEAFQPLAQAITLILQLIRKSHTPEQEVATKGHYQKPLQPQNPCQMVRIAIPNTAGIYPEVSGSKHQFNIRFLQANTKTERATPTTQDVPFQLTCCTI